MKNARSITAQLGGSWHGQYGTTPCPVCQPERRRDQIALSIVTVRPDRSAAPWRVRIVSTTDSGHYGVWGGASNEAALDRRREAVDLFSDGGAGRIGRAGRAPVCRRSRAGMPQVARRYAMNANLIFKWLHDPRFAPDPELATAGVPCFLPVEIVDQALDKDEPPVVEAGVAKGTIEIEHAGGHRLRISGAYDPGALAHLIRVLSG